MRKLFALAWSLTLAALAPAGVLTWEQSSQVVETQCGQTEVVAIYPFRNLSDRPVQIVRTPSGCGCIAATAAPSLCAPGARGELRVVFTLGDRVGEQTREILVETDVAPGAPDHVTLVVRIPSWVTLTPRLLGWERGAPAQEKRVTVQFLDPASGEILRIRCEDPAWEIRRDTVPGAAGVQELWIRPRDTREARRGELAVTVRLGQQERTFRLFTFVQ